MIKSSHLWLDYGAVLFAAFRISNTDRIILYFTWHVLNNLHLSVYYYEYGRLWFWMMNIQAKTYRFPTGGLNLFLDRIKYTVYYIPGLERYYRIYFRVIWVKTNSLPGGIGWCVSSGFVLLYTFYHILNIWICNCRHGFECVWYNRSSEQIPFRKTCTEKAFPRCACDNGCWCEQAILQYIDRCSLDKCNAHLNSFQNKFASVACWWHTLLHLQDPYPDSFFETKPELDYQHNASPVIDVFLTYIHHWMPIHISRIWKS